MAENKKDGGFTIGTGSRDDSILQNATIENSSIGKIDNSTVVKDGGIVMTREAQDAKEAAFDNRLKHIFNPIGARIDDTNKAMDSVTADFHKGLDKLFGKKTPDVNAARFDSAVNMSVPAEVQLGDKNEMSK